MRYLGQHFLRNKNIVKRIADLAELSKSDVVLEIGPGKGILTEELLNRAGKIIAVEKDRKLCEFLSDKFSNEIEKERLILIKGDILQIKNAIPSARDKNQNEDAKLKSYKDVKILPWQDFDISFSRTKNYKIAANIPYYITSRFLKIFLGEIKTQPQKMVLMVQKEVAERVCETPPKNILAISVQVYGEPKVAFRVSAGNFFPPPKVDSAIIVINGISKKFFSDISEKKFFNIIRTGFSKKRKILINNLSKGLNKEKVNLEKVFKKCCIDNLNRAENLSLQNWKCLCSLLN